MRRALLGLAALVGACTEPPEPDEVWAVRGVFEAPADEGRAARIRHEAVPGLMDAMRMDLELEAPREIAGLAPETPIAFEMTWTDGRTRVRRITLLPDTVSLDVPPPLPSF